MPQDLLKVSKTLINFEHEKRLDVLTVLKDSNYHALLLLGQYFHVLLTLVAAPEWLNLFVFLIKK